MNSCYSADTASVYITEGGELVQSRLKFFVRFINLRGMWKELENKVIDANGNNLNGIYYKNKDV